MNPLKQATFCAPLLIPLQPLASQESDWPRREKLQLRIDAADLRVSGGHRLRLVAPDGGRPYEQRLHDSGELEFRERNWHDWFNLLIWLAYPRAKAALNARHHAAWPEASVSRRGAVRDALTLFDESGLVVLSDDPSLLALIRGFEWKRLFWERRADCLTRLQVLPFGHALCEKMLKPYRGITGQALLLEVTPQLMKLDARELPAAIDARLAAIIADAGVLAGTKDLAPLPVLGIPGWCADNADPAYYDDTRQFRSGRRMRAAELAR